MFTCFVFSYVTVFIQVQEALRGLLDQDVMLRMARAMDSNTQHLSIPSFARGDSYIEVSALHISCPHSMHAYGKIREL